MKRANFKTDLIITADWHLMEEEKQPPCRLDSIWDAQWDKVKQIKELQEKYDCPVYIAGDTFEHWKTSPNLLNSCIVNMPKKVFCIIGNHEEPQHNIGLMHKSGFDTLLNCNIINYLFLGGRSWGTEKEEIVYNDYKNKKIIMAHMMTWQGKEPWPGCTDPEANKIFNIFPEADLIITGHNHKTFIAKKGNRLLINPGSLTRHKADQMDHKPCVFLWNAKYNTYKIHYLKVKKEVISREHIEIQKEKEKNINIFLSKLNNKWSAGLSFRENITIALKENKIPKHIEQIILNWLGE